MFMAPTKPLVAQQIEACFNVMGIPQVRNPENEVKKTTSLKMSRREACNRIMWHPVVNVS